MASTLELTQLLGQSISLQFLIQGKGGPHDSTQVGDPSVLVFKRVQGMTEFLLWCISLHLDASLNATPREACVAFVVNDANCEHHPGSA
eukprot:1159653-Pelagomonas_calceolata.AAC.2